MKKNLKLIKIFSTAIAVLVFAQTISSSTVFASEEFKYDLSTPVEKEVYIDNILKPNNETDNSKDLSEIGAMSVKKELHFDNITVPLFVTFDDPGEALQKISQNPVILEIKKIYGYSDISDDNWTEYYDALFELLDLEECPIWYTEENMDFRMLRKFFDVFENDSKNNEIELLVTENKTSSFNQKNTKILELLPYDSFLVVSEKCDILKNEDSLLAANNLGFNIQNGITYATNHATSPNTADYDKFSSDCTNFTSQILENGGISQEVYSDENKGWWHTKSKVAFVTVHKHSISWIRANTFAKYMGVGYTTTSNSSFSSNIQAGDFIAADYDSDGDWNHMGFVTDRKTTQSNGYYDYKVAQHTSNYHEWTSSSKNGWENVGKDGGTYGRVRR